MRWLAIAEILASLQVRPGSISGQWICLEQFQVNLLVFGAGQFLHREEEWNCDEAAYKHGGDPDHL